VAAGTRTAAQVFRIATRTSGHPPRESRAVLEALDPALNDATPYLFVLLGIIEGTIAGADGSKVKKQRTLDAIKRIVVRESSNSRGSDLRGPALDRRADQALLDLLATASPMRGSCYS